MTKHLFFICPTDCLETVINNKIAQENYFHTILANTSSFKSETLGYIKDMLELKNIREITFVLSQENQFLKNLLATQDVFYEKRLYKLRNEILFDEKRFKLLFYNRYNLLFLINYYLIKKANAFDKALHNCWFKDQITINIKLYNNTINEFTDVNINSLINSCFELN